jgi:lipopolysaccharide/colanic/teichoic acid biosynthesis glycosyltransferase
MMWVLVAVGIAFVNLIVGELVGWLPWVVERVVQWAARALPTAERCRYEEEWLAELDVLPVRGISSLIFALRLLIHARRVRQELIEAALRPKRVRFALKHTIDRTWAALSLFILAPVVSLAALSVFLSSRGPVLDRQRRIGRDGTEFDLFKFRSTKRIEMPVPVVGKYDEQRTLVGRVLRYTSIDELPQLLNVLRGEMSLIGPRPERPEFVELFGQHIPRYQERHRLKSGITGWAQVHGLRGQTSLAERVELDNYYADHWSLKLDLKIALLSLLAIWRSSE